MQIEMPFSFEISLDTFDAVLLDRGVKTRCYSMFCCTNKPFKSEVPISI